MSTTKGVAAYNSHLSYMLSGTACPYIYYVFFSIQIFLDIKIQAQLCGDMGVFQLKYHSKFRGETTNLGMMKAGSNYWNIDSCHSCSLSTHNAACIYCIPQVMWSSLDFNHFVNELSINFGVKT